MARDLPLYRLLAGERLERPPRAFWRHFPNADTNPATFAETIVSFQQRHRFDLVKITPPSSYGLADYGQPARYVNDLLGRPMYGPPLIQAPEQWGRLPRLAPTGGRLGEHLQCVRAVVQQLGGAVPIVTTIFSPLSQARLLAGQDRLREHMRDASALVRTGLSRLAENIAAFIEVLDTTGVDGIFFVIQEQEPLGAQLAEEWGGALNRALLASCKSRIRMLHVHGRVETLRSYFEYPVNILHWHDVPGCPERSLEAVSLKFNGVVSGGLDWPMEGCDPDVAVASSRALFERMAGRPYLFSANCVLPIAAPSDAIDRLVAIDT